SPPGHRPASHSFPTRRSSDLLRGLTVSRSDQLLVAQHGVEVLPPQVRGVDARSRDGLAEVRGPGPDRFDLLEAVVAGRIRNRLVDRKSTRPNSSHRTISYAVV